jgi:hypothetical protein
VYVYILYVCVVRKFFCSFILFYFILFYFIYFIFFFVCQNTENNGQSKFRFFLLRARGSCYLTFNSLNVDLNHEWAMQRYIFFFCKKKKINKNKFVLAHKKIFFVLFKHYKKKKSCYKSCFFIGPAYVTRETFLMY